MAVIDAGVRTRGINTIGEGGAHLFPEPHLRSCEFIEAAAETDLTQWFGVAWIGTSPGHRNRRVLATITTPSRKHLVAMYHRKYALEFCKGYLPRRESMQLEWPFSSV